MGSRFMEKSLLQIQSTDR